MNRRTLLKLATAAALAGCGSLAPRRDLRVVVAGAGIVGASIAYHLAKSGASVTVLDKQGPATHASRGTFAWINATWAKQPRHYHKLSQEGVANWGALQQTLNLPVKWGGSLEWFDSATRQELLSSQIAEQVEWGEPAGMLNAAETLALEPRLRIDSQVRAAYSPNDGAVDPVVATKLLLNAAERLGATVTYPVHVEGASLSGGRLTSVETTAGSIEADRLVLATGAADTPEHVAGIGIPQRTTPGVIAITKPMPQILNRIIAAPGVHMHQRNDGRIVLGEQDGAPDTEAHAIRLQGRPNDFPSKEMATQHGGRMLSIAQQFIPEIAAAEIDAAYIGWRPLPVDGHPVLGESPAKRDVYLAIMHSGISLAPIVGQLVAHELLEGEPVGGLEWYRPSRSFETVRRY